MGKKKKDGKIFTPIDTARKMLGLLEYCSLERRNDGTIYWSNMEKHIIDNSCGDGAFLSLIVDFYCHNVKITTRKNKAELKSMLETYIHGIELDPVEYKKCIANLDEIAELNGLKGVKWDIQNRDALSCHDYDGKIDFVIANPPYIRTHDLDCDLSDYSFTTEGMKDIYLAFYELGFRMLNETGKMCYITPSSWFTSLAGQKMRDYIIENRNLEYVEDYGHYQLFENATTYVAITRFGKVKTDTVKYVRMERTQDDDGFWQCTTDIPFDDMNIGGKFYFGTENQLSQMREIVEYAGNKDQEKIFQVKNGFATLADEVFINKRTPIASRVYHAIRSWNIIPVIKHVNGISPVNLQSFDQDIIERFQQRIVLQSAFPQRHQHLPDTARPLGCFRKTVFPQLLIRFRKRNFLGNRQIPGLFRTGQFQKMNVETAVILPIRIRIATRHPHKRSPRRRHPPRQLQHVFPINHTFPPTVKIFETLCL